MWYSFTTGQNDLQLALRVVVAVDCWWKVAYYCIGLVNVWNGGGIQQVQKYRVPNMLLFWYPQGCLLAAAAGLLRSCRKTPSHLSQVVDTCVRRLTSSVSI